MPPRRMASLSRRDPARRITADRVTLVALRLALLVAGCGEKDGAADDRARSSPQTTTGTTTATTTDATTRLHGGRPTRS